MQRAGQVSVQPTVQPFPSHTAGAGLGQAERAASGAYPLPPRPAQAARLAPPPAPECIRKLPSAGCAARSRLSQRGRKHPRSPEAGATPERPERLRKYSGLSPARSRAAASASGRLGHGVIHSECGGAGGHGAAVALLPQGLPGHCGLRLPQCMPG